MFLIILYLYNLCVYILFNNPFIILVDFLDPNIQYRKIEKEQDAQKTNIPLGHYGYGCA